VQIRRPAHAAQQPAPVQFGGHGHGVGRLAAAVQIQDGVVDELIARPVEVPGAQPLQDVGDRVLAQQHAAEHRLLGGQILRGLASEVLTGGRLCLPGIPAISGTTQVIYHGHAETHPLLLAIERTFDNACRDCRSGPRQVIRRRPHRSRDGQR
jgi:hypothetical protein